MLDRFAQEGLLKARPTGGFVASEFTVEDIRDAIEIRGVLEGAAARLAAERPKNPDDVTALRGLIVALDARCAKSRRYRVFCPLYRPQWTVPRAGAGHGEKRYAQSFHGARADPPFRAPRTRSS